MFSRRQNSTANGAIFVSADESQPIRMIFLFKLNAHKNK